MSLNSNTISGLNVNTTVLTSRPRTFARKTLDGGNIGINGLAAGAKLLSAVNSLGGFNWSIGNALSTGGELITRTAMIGQSGLGLYDGLVEKKNVPIATGQALEIGLICAAENKDKWLLRGLSQGVLNIVSPIIKAYEKLQQALGNKELQSYGSDYSSLSLSSAFKEAFTTPFKVYGKNLLEIIKKPSLIKENLTYALSVASTFMGAGGLLGLTPFKGIASVVRFMGAVPADVIYAFMGHHLDGGYDPKNKFDMKKMFDFSSYLGWAGKLWLIPGLLDPIKRLPSLENIMEPLTDICDAFDRCASAFYQASLFSTTSKVTEPVQASNESENLHAKVTEKSQAKHTTNTNGANSNSKAAPAFKLAYR